MARSRGNLEKLGRVIFVGRRGEKWARRPNKLKSRRERGRKSRGWIARDDTLSRKEMEAAALCHANDFDNDAHRLHGVPFNSSNR